MDHKSQMSQIRSNLSLKRLVFPTKNRPERQRSNKQIHFESFTPISSNYFYGKAIFDL
jgi:hypothetical protein